MIKGFNPSRVIRVPKEVEGTPQKDGKCVDCGQPIEPGFLAHCRPCRKRWVAIFAVPEPEENRCLLCGEPFTKNTPWQKHCSELCQTITNNGKQRNKRLKQAETYTVLCKHCGKTSEKPIKSGPKSEFCNKRCMQAFYREKPEVKAKKKASYKPVGGTHTWVTYGRQDHDRFRNIITEYGSLAEYRKQRSATDTIDPNKNLARV